MAQLLFWDASGGGRGTDTIAQAVHSEHAGP